MNKINNIIPSDKKVKVIQNLNGGILIRAAIGGNTKPVVRKMKDNFYYNEETGEVIERLSYSSIKGDNIHSLTKSLKKFADMLYYNISDNKLALMYNLTYREKTINTKQVMKDHEYFIKKLRNKYEIKYGNIEYFCSLEFNNNLDCLHIHGVLYFPNSKTKPIIPVDELMQTWKKGYVDITAAKNISSLIGYLIPHQTDSEKEYAKKMNEKYERLCKMPSGMNVFRHSKGMKHPVTEKMLYSEALSLLDNYQLETKRVFSKKVFIFKQGRFHHITYIYEYYSKKPDVIRPHSIQ